MITIGKVAVGEKAGHVSTCASLLNYIIASRIIHHTWSHMFFLHVLQRFARRRNLLNTVRWE